jgi:hypothetical protein
MILVDCQAPGISKLLEDTFDHFGNHICYAGAGVGFHDLRQAPSVFTGTGFIPHGGLLLYIPSRATVNVRHGWSRVHGPFIATRVRGNVIQELNWEPAGSFFRDQVEALAPALKGRPVFPDLVSGFTLSIGKEGGEDVIRDPISINAADELVVLSDVPENAAMYLSQGDASSLLQAAQQAVAECNPADAVDNCFIVECFSRALMLKDGFPRELEAVTAALQKFTDVPAEGILALGEIASSGRTSLEFYNKTFVVRLASTAA